MKRVLFAILFLTAISTLLNCKKSFLESTSQDGSLTDQSAFQNKNFYDSYIFGTYSEQQGSSGNGWAGVFPWITISGSIMQDITQTDETTQPIGNILTTSHPAIANMWQSFYTMVGRANTILSNLATAPASIENSDKIKIDGESKFLRGYAYFNLARAFGNIPMVLTTFNQSQLSMVQTSEDLVWDQVIKDLTDASKELPTRQGWGSENLGRATKGSALAYLVNAYMYKKDWANAKLTSESLIALNEYSLLPNVRDVFSKLHGNTNESIFEVQYRDVNDGNVTWNGTGPEQGNNVSEWTAPRNIGSQWAPAGGWGANVTNIKLANSFEPGDDRRKKLMVTVGETYQGEAMTSPLTIPNTIIQPNSAFTTKYWFGPASALSNYYRGPNLIQMRYAEFLLNYAEILFQSGNAAGAYQQLNLIRNRAKLSNKPVLTDVNGFLTDLMNERRWELNWEPNLWYHYLRTGTAANFLQNVYGITMSSAWKRYPIPQKEIDLNPNLKQNIGY